mmetsp:Transcript_23799/g.66692  ORF Transcript_23799/g.66692 Transcript_23799/m.66692 type:complete len:370 (-) Transcript_23799:2423-3532(-)
MCVYCGQTNFRRNLIIVFLFVYLFSVRQCSKHDFSWVQGSPVFRTKLAATVPTPGWETRFKNHIFILIIGLHHSGTSLTHFLLAQHPNVSAFHNTGSFQDEGQHLQSVFPTAHEMGRADYLRNPRARATEQSIQNLKGARGLLFSQWEVHWDLKKRFLLEKDPTNMLRARFLQALLSPSCFLTVVRHPFSYLFARNQPPFCNNSLAVQLLEDVASAYTIFAADSLYLNTVCLFRMERMLLAPQLWWKDVCACLGLPPSPLPETLLGSGEAKTDHSTSSLSRSLLELRRDRRKVILDREESLHWAKKWSESLHTCPRKAKHIIRRLQIDPSFAIFSSFGYVTAPPYIVETEKWSDRYFSWIPFRHSMKDG